MSPCRYELPFLQRQAVKRGAQVAFLGVNSDDNRDDARKLGARYPMPYPSFEDPRQAVAGRYGARRPAGDRVLRRAAASACSSTRAASRSEAQLAAEIDRYALGRARSATCRVRIDPLPACARSSRDRAIDPLLRRCAAIDRDDPSPGTRPTPPSSTRAAAARRPRTCARAAPAARRAARPLYTRRSPRAARGAHELIVNGPRPVTSLAELTVEQVAGGRRGLARAHARARAAPPTCTSASTSGSRPARRAAHSQAQLYALDFVPAVVARERERFSAHAVRTMGANLLEDLVAGGGPPPRRAIVAIDDEAVLLCPYASSAPYALMLAPRRRRERFEDDGPERRGAAARRAVAPARAISVRARR